MASGFFALLDDIAVLMDDVAAMSKMATKKTAGILVDDLAVNAEKSSGFVSSRELPVLWQITKGSFLNKLIILPVAFLLSAFLPAAIPPILLIGGVYLGYEGAHKVYEWIFKRGQKKEKVPVSKMSPDEAVAYEQEKVKAAILVDFILSVEIVILTLGTVADQPLNIRIGVATVVALLATIGVYGLVALLVRMDDFGYKLIALREGNTGFAEKVGQLMVKSLPVIVRALGILGTIAMILVAGGIFVHNIHAVHNWVHNLPAIVGEFLVGLAVGFIALPIISGVKKLFKKK